MNHEAFVFPGIREREYAFAQAAKKYGPVGRVLRTTSKIETPQTTYHFFTATRRADIDPMRGVLWSRIVVDPGCDPECHEMCRALERP